MNSTTSMTSNQINNILTENSFEEPNIRKAQFVVSLNRNRIYTLEFDHNIEMQELKIMIQKAAHLKKNTFGLFCNGENYSQYTEETFDSLFPEETLVVFTLEPNKGEEIIDETELLLQINMPCPEHDYKFLLYYCYDCEKSICSECFTNGAHKGHRIQDKCFYLLPSKYLVKKMFENWSKKPYEDFQISVDLQEYKNNLNNVTFKQLFEMLKQVQIKCNELIDKYNTINQKSLFNIRDSVRNIQASCIKALDEYKDLINIKDIVNNQEVFIDFDHIYKDMGNKQKERFKENLLKFQELNRGVSILVENLINDVCQMINDVLLKAIDNKQYEDVEQKINLKLIRPVNQNDIINQISDRKNRKKKINKKNDRKLTINSNYNKFVNNISEGVGLELKKNSKEKKINNYIGRNTIIPENLSSNIAFGNNSNINNINNENDLSNSNGKSYDSLNNDFQTNNKNKNNNINNYSVDSTFKKPEDNNVFNNNINNNTNTQMLNNFNPNDNNIPSNIDDYYIEYEDDDNNNDNNINFPNPNTNSNDKVNSTNDYFERPANIPEYQNKENDNNNNSLNQSTQNMDNNIKNQNEKEIKEEKPKQNNIYGSILDITKSNNNNSNNNLHLFNTESTKQKNMLIMNQISPIPDNRILNSNSNNTSFNYDNINSNSSQPKILNIFNTENDNIPKNPFQTDNNDNNNNNNNNNNNDNNDNDNQKPLFSNIISQNNNFNLSSPFSQISSNNNIINTNNDNNSNQNSNSNSNNSSSNNNNNNNRGIKLDNKYLNALANNCKTILEEVNESGSEIKTYKEKEKTMKIEYYLKKSFVLCPIPTTNNIKIITDLEADDNLISLTFPNNFKISTFLYNCAHCNYNKKLFISGGIINIPSNLSSNIFLMIDIDINNNNGSYITELAPMIYNRSGHSMIGYNNFIYAVGGEYTNKVEKYDITNNKWIEINPMIKKKSNTMLFINDGYLYTFFGKGENENYPECIERLNIENNNSVWEMIFFNNPNNIDTRRYGCGLYHVDELIYFIGGKCNEKPTDEIFFFNLSERRIDFSDSKFKWKESFRESTLFHIGNKIVQISDEKFYGIYLTIMVQ